MPESIIFTIITPSTGKRPKALANAIASVQAALDATPVLDASQIEMLIGYDGVKGPRLSNAPFVKFFDLPFDGDFGNAIRNMLLKAAKGTHILLLDDDNAFTTHVFNTYIEGLDHDMQVARIDVSRAFDITTLPRPEDGKELIRQGNIDPLCLCLSKDLMLIRSNGWGSEGGYESDYINIFRYYRRANKLLLHDEVVGVYDAGAGLDEQGMNERQQAGKS